MASRREFLLKGLSAVALGALPRIPVQSPLFVPDPRPPGAPGIGDPFLELPTEIMSVDVNGMPFAPWYGGDSFDNQEIPFHSTTGIQPPTPSERVDVAVVGGGISGLATAWLLRRHHPVVFELRDRFGGNAQAELWQGTPYSLGSAYVITPDRGTFLEELYRELGLDRLRRESFPPDPIEIGGRILHDFWSGAGRPAGEQEAFARYAGVVTRMADEAYPEIPLSSDPDAIAQVLALDVKTFRADVEEQMGLPLPPILAAAIQSYFYSSFGAGIDEISAASGWNFVAAEEFGRWVFPGGNGTIARNLWRDLNSLQQEIAPAPPSPLLRPGSRVVDVRPRGKRIIVSWVDHTGALRSLSARHVVMAGSKHICKHVLHDLVNWDAEKLLAFDSIETASYLMANVLVDAEIERDLYDVFLVGDENFPMGHGELESQRPVIDVLRGDYTGNGPRSVLSLYWPLPFPGSRFTLIVPGGWSDYAQRAVPQIREVLSLLDVPESAVRQVRLVRWGHALPIARPGFIADGSAGKARRPLNGRVHFVNQDNWALPAVENSLLDAQEVARRIDDAL